MTRGNAMRVIDTRAWILAGLVALWLAACAPAQAPANEDIITDAVALPEDELVGADGEIAVAATSPGDADAPAAGDPAGPATGDDKPPRRAYGTGTPPPPPPPPPMPQGEDPPVAGTAEPLELPATDTGPDDLRPGAGAPDGDAAAEVPLVDEEAVANDRALRFLHKANIAFSTPREINRDETADVVLLLSRKESIEALKDAIEAEVTGGREGKQIQIASRVEARLTGLGFEITPAAGIVQAVGTEDRVMWNWQVRPKATGPQTLTLTLVAKLDRHGVADKTLKAYTRRIEVQVTPSQRVGDFASRNWQWLWGAILVPLAAAGRAWYTKRKKSEGTVA